MCSLTGRWGNWHRAPILAKKSSSATRPTLGRNGHANKQNCQIWDDVHPYEVHQVEINPQKVTVWCEFWADIISLYFFENDDDIAITVNGERYRSMITNFLWLKLDMWYGCGMTHGSNRTALSANNGHSVRVWLSHTERTGHLNRVIWPSYTFSCGVSLSRKSQSQHNPCHYHHQKLGATQRYCDGHLNDIIFHT